MLFKLVEVALLGRAAEDALGMLARMSIADRETAGLREFRVSLLTECLERGERWPAPPPPEESLSAARA